MGKLNSTTFTNFTTLQSLNLRNTSLLFDNLSPFKSFNTLKKIDISYNNLGMINFDLLSKYLEYLVEFRVAYCKITNVSEVIRHFPPYINTLDVSGNFLDEINAKILRNLKHIDHLYLGNTNL